MKNKISLLFYIIVTITIVVPPVCQVAAGPVTLVTKLVRGKPGQWKYLPENSDWRCGEREMEDTESARVLGVGVGLFLIILIWSLAVAGLLFLTRLKTGPSVGLLTAASLLTMLLLLIPRKVSTLSPLII